MVATNVKEIMDIHERLTELMSTFEPHEQAKINSALLALGSIDAPELPDAPEMQRAPEYTNYLNGARVIARTKEAIYVRIPEQLQVPSSFADGKCSCGHCDGSGRWDTVVISLKEQRPFDFTYTVHMPDGAIAGFMDYMKRKGKV